MKGLFLPCFSHSAKPGCGGCSCQHLGLSSTLSIYEAEAGHLWCGMRTEKIGHGEWFCIVQHYHVDCNYNDHRKHILLTYYEHDLPILFIRLNSRFYCVFVLLLLLLLLLCLLLLLLLLCFLFFLLFLFFSFFLFFFFFFFFLFFFFLLIRHLLIRHLLVVAAGIAVFCMLPVLLLFVFLFCLRQSTPSTTKSL